MAYDGERAANMFGHEGGNPGDGGPQEKREFGDRGDRGGYRGGSRDDRGGNRPRGGKPYGDRGGRDDRGPRSGGGRGDRPYGNRDGNRSFGDRDGGRGGRGDRPFGGDRDRKPYGDRGPRRDDRGGRPSGDRDDRGPRRDFDRGDRKPFDRDRGPRRDGDRPFGGDRDRKPYGDRDRGPRRDFDRDRGPRRDGDRKPFGDRDRNDRGPRPGGPRPGGGKPGGGRRDDRAPRKMKEGTKGVLKHDLEVIDGRSFSSYKDLYGRYSFDGFDLSIDHVQSDPFSTPSHMSVRVPQDVAEFPPELFDTPWRLVALEDALLRKFSRSLATHSPRFEEPIKGGLMSTSRPGPEVLKRSAITVDAEAVTVRFDVLLPAYNRTVLCAETMQMLFEVLPRCVREALLHVSYEAEELQAVADLADDQHALREAVAEQDLVCFVADGSILPRETGISPKPMAEALPFASPETLRTTVSLPHAGEVCGMGIKRGVTLIVGGGYHGKSTLLKAVQTGVYDHVRGDGRELVVTDAAAVKLRAEDGRSVRDADISLFIENLPNGADTLSFWTEDASGSTSQAAGTMEAYEAGARVFLIDEDTSAANFMVRDELMQAAIAPEQEPITPLIERLRDLYEQAGVSTLIVAGSSGAFFTVADTIIQMDSYVPHDITEQVRTLCAERGVQPVKSAPGFEIHLRPRNLVTPPHPLMRKTAVEDKKERAARREANLPDAPDRIKVKVFSGADIVAGTLGADLRLVEQLVDGEQAKTLAHIVRWCIEKDAFARMSVREIVDVVCAEMETGGLCAVSDARTVECGLAMPRRQEIFACLNRLRLRN